MAVPRLAVPPPSRTSYIIDQLEGERLTIPGSKGVFRILASSKQTNKGIAVFSSGAVLSDAPGFHWHEKAHDVFLVTKGYLKLWVGDQCRILGPGDFAYVPPHVVHNPEMMGPHTETMGLVAPGDWVDFFRYVSETFSGLILPETDDRNLGRLLGQKMMVAKEDFDVHFKRDHVAAPVTEWKETENVIPSDESAYYLRANTGPRWMLGGVMSRPFIHAQQNGGKFAITSIESSSLYEHQALDRWVSFKSVDHCLFVLEGLLEILLQGEGNEWESVREGQTLFIAAGETFKLRFSSRYVRALSFANGRGIEELVRTAGESFSGFVLPDTASSVDEAKLKEAASSLDIQL